MSITKRQEQILDLLREHSFLSVERLSKLTYTSESSIRRDLTKLQNLCFIKRTHGGASLLGEEGGVPPLVNRMTANITGKRKIARSAAALLRDGQSIMLDGSSTAGFLIPHIAKHKDIVLFTNNMMTAVSAINHGIRTSLIGGESVRGSAVLSGPAAYKAVGDIHVDILFFSSASLDKNGVISDPTEEENYLRQLMIRSAQTCVFLCDSEKFNTHSLYLLTTLDDVDVAVFDEPFSDLRAKCRIL